MADNIVEVLAGDNVSVVKTDAQGPIVQVTVQGIAGPKGPASPYNYSRNNRAFTQSIDSGIVTLNAPGDGTYTRVYTRGSGAVPADWPVDYGRATILNSAGHDYEYAPSYTGQFPKRIMTDGDGVAIYVNAANVGDSMMVYVDGAPTSVTPLLFAASGMQLVTIEFGSGNQDTRLIEFVGSFSIAVVYVRKPFKAWKPDPFIGSKMYVIGDSYALPTVYGNSPSTSILTATNYGIYQSMAPILGLEEILVDGQGGTGYGWAGAGHHYQDRVDGTGGSLVSAVSYTPDMLVFHGGGANDFYNGRTDAQVLADATNAFKKARNAMPNTKLVFIEGFSTPIFTYTARYITLRQALQTALTGVGVYYIDVQTSSPWINGLGYVNHVNADGENANIYVGNDGVHLTVDGNAYVRDRLAPKFRTILRDTGALLNTLV